MRRPVRQANACPIGKTLPPQNIPLWPFHLPPKTLAILITKRSHPMSNEIKRIGVGARMSEAVCYNGIVWVAGQVGNPGDSVEDQTRTCLAEVDRILAEAGTDKSRILSTQIWLADISTFADMNKVWDQWVPAGHTPARATGEAKLATPDYKVEVIVTAALK
jgi:enamine deaminase RidA (YjgF/YER057c/UK114 family)